MVAFVLAACTTAGGKNGDGDMGGVTAGQPSGMLDPAVVQSATGVMPEVLGSVVKVSYPRSDLPIQVDGITGMSPFMGLTSYASFTPDANAGMEAMVMGDFVLLEDEVNPVMSAALNAGLQVTALHNHFFFDTPHVYFMHIGGEGSLSTLAGAVKASMAAQLAVRQQAPQPAQGFGGAPPSMPSQIDGSKLDPVFTVTGTAKTGMYKAVMGRTIASSCCSMGAAMGLQTWAAFAGTMDNAVVDGDFAVTAAELQPVLKSLRGNGINIVSIHQHITMDETPRLVFLHYWGRGAAMDLATKVKQAVDLTAWDGRRM